MNPRVLRNRKRAIDQCIANSFIHQQSVEIAGIPGISMQRPKGFGESESHRHASENLSIRDGDLDALAFGIGVLAR